MKKIFVLFFLLLGFEFCGVAQNRYWNHLAQYIPHPEHCVPIMHSDGFVYYCQSMNYLLSVAKLNSNTMFPMQDMTWELFDNQANMIFNFQLHGGFENASGELVLYGYDDVEMCAAICVVNFSIQDTKYLLFQSPIVSTGALIEGCNGHDIHGDEVYLFVDENGRIISMIPFLSSGNTAIVKPTPYNYLWSIKQLLPISKVEPFS
ncbi:MAG: hypothetical protein J6T86_09830 [Bacteroidales bacterium]|nr:hypothetical protein [Bacteroidales bacterium]